MKCLTCGDIENQEQFKASRGSPSLQDAEIVAIKKNVYLNMNCEIKFKRNWIIDKNIYDSYKETKLKRI